MHCHIKHQGTVSLYVTNDLNPILIRSNGHLNFWVAPWRRKGPNSRTVNAKLKFCILSFQIKMKHLKQ